MFKRQISVNIKDLDLKIGKLTKELDLMGEDDEKYEVTMMKIDSLTDLRCKLHESRVEGSIKPIVLSGLLGVIPLILVLKYEEKEVITSKAFNMLPSMFKGSK